MTIKEAEQIRDDFDETKDPTEEELFVLTEAMELLIRENHSPSLSYNRGYIFSLQPLSGRQEALISKELMYP